MKKYTEDHEWVELNGDTATVGITDYAQEQLGDIVFIELPKNGDTLTQGNKMAVVESVKAASDIYAPLDGEVISTNSNLVDEPALLNSDAETAWIVKLKIKNKADFENLLNEADYKKIAQ